MPQTSQPRPYQPQPLLSPTRLSDLGGAWAGWSRATARILGPLLPPQEQVQRLCHALLENPQETLLTPPHAEAMAILWSIAFHAARFGALDAREIAEGFTPFLVPPIPSERLVAYSVISAPETLWQIRARQIARAERGKGPPENRVIIKAATRAELARFALHQIVAERPILLIEEHYTIAIPHMRHTELDRMRCSALLREGGAPQLMFLGEAQEPHAHVALGPQGLTAKWYRIDASTHPDFEIPPSNALPQAYTVEHPIPASHEHLAGLLVLFVEGTRQALAQQPAA